MATAGALEDQELMSEGKNLSLQRCAGLKGLPSRRKQRENDREHVAESYSDGYLNSTGSVRTEFLVGTPSLVPSCTEIQTKSTTLLPCVPRQCESGGVTEGVGLPNPALFGLADFDSFGWC